MDPERSTPTTIDTEPEHQIYTGHRHSGNQLYLYGKCRCGAYLKDRDAIERHRLLAEHATN